MAKPPQKLDSESAGYDLTSAETHIIKSNSIAKIATDLALEIPAQCYGRIASRSGIALNNKLNVFAGIS
jgi:dUTP pyrophosphatase